MRRSSNEKDTYSDIQGLGAPRRRLRPRAPLPPAPADGGQKPIPSSHSALRHPSSSLHTQHRISKSAALTPPQPSPCTRYAEPLSAPPRAGFNLAREIDRHVQQLLLPLGKLSVVAHSLGGIIARTALSHPLMHRYRDKFHTYCSLGSAHLGYQYSDNSFVDGGMWFLKKLKNSTALHQASLTAILRAEAAPCRLTCRAARSPAPPRAASAT